MMSLFAAGLGLFAATPRIEVFVAFGSGPSAIRVCVENHSSLPLRAVAPEIGNTLWIEFLRDGKKPTVRDGSIVSEPIAANRIIEIAPLAVSYDAWDPGKRYDLEDGDYTLRVGYSLEGLSASARRRADHIQEAASDKYLLTYKDRRLVSISRT